MCMYVCLHRVHVHSRVSVKVKGQLVEVGFLLLVFVLGMELELWQAVLVPEPCYRLSAFRSVTLLPPP